MKNVLLCADIGSVANERFGWARLDLEDEAVESHRGGIEIRDLVEAVATDVGAGRNVALGFECPLFVPVPPEPHLLGKARLGEGNRSWSAGAGSGALATGLVEVAWILRELSERLPATVVHLDWKRFERDGGLFLWEAFVTGLAKGGSHVDDAAVAVRAFRDAMPTPDASNAVTADSPISLIGAALLWSRWSLELDLLHTPALVIKAEQPTGDAIDSDVTSRTHRDKAEIERKLMLLDEPHIRPLTTFVQSLRGEHGNDSVPFFDPTEAGTEAQILMLFENPGRRADATQGSGFISADNDDPTANNMWHFLKEAGIERRRHVVAWNIVPWYLGDAKRIGKVTNADLVESRPALAQLLQLLPGLKVVILFGKKAQQGWEEASPSVNVPVLRAPHPSGRWLNGHPEDRAKIADVLREALRLAELAGKSHPRRLNSI